MENQKNNKGIIALLIVIIIILSTLCVLLATGTISFKSNEVNNDINNVIKNVRYYQYYKTYDNNTEDPTYISREIELNVDGTAKWRFGGNGSGGEYYVGTYTEDSNKIVLSLERDMPNNTVCDDNNTIFPCNTALTLNKNQDNTISSINELGNEGLSYIYKTVEKSQLHFLK